MNNFLKVLKILIVMKITFFKVPAYFYENTY